MTENPPHHQIKTQIRYALIPALIFLCAFLLIPVNQFKGFLFMPGDLGDARFNNYLLENIYQFLIGNRASVWETNYFWPFQNTITFSDNHLGASPVYLLGRVLTGESDTAYQLWFYFGYFANYLAAYISLSKLGISRISSAVGAAIFAFALPASAHVEHSQLHYRFAIPFTLTYFVLFLKYKNWKYLLTAEFWLVWQLFLGVYMGVFSFFMLLTIGTAFLGYERLDLNNSFLNIARQFKFDWSDQSPKEKTFFFTGFLVLASLIGWLFYPYFNAAQAYGFVRGWNEIYAYLPRFQSYFMSDNSKIWGDLSANLLINLPVRHEHQIFIGLVPLTLSVAGILVGARSKDRFIISVLLFSLIIAILLTITAGGYSFWYIFHWMPIVSAIRVVTRIVLVFLFPIAFFAGIFLDQIAKSKTLISKVIIFFSIALFLLEASLIDISRSEKSEWRDRITKAIQDLPADLNGKQVIFSAQKDDLFYIWELDAMWVASSLGLQTLNGYSGNFPPGYRIIYGDDCSELPRRIVSFLDFSGKSGDLDAYRSLINQVTPMGFDDCDPDWFDAPPQK